MENNINNEDRVLQLTRLLNAPRQLVWEVFSNPEHIKQWWGPTGFTNSIFKMDFVAGGEWDFIMHGPDGKDYKNTNIFRELVKPEKIVYEHVSTPWHITTITFEEQGDKTLLRWHMLFESKEQFEQVVKTFKADEGLQQNIKRLENYLTHKKPGSFSIERTLNAPVEKVWHAITDAAAMKQWYFDLPEFKAEVGFEFHFYGKGNKGEQYLHRCKITTVIPHQTLAYSWTYEGYDGFSLVTFELKPAGDKTIVTITHDGLDTFATNNEDFARESFAKGWTYILGTSLAGFVE